MQYTSSLASRTAGLAAMVALLGAAACGSNNNVTHGDLGVTFTCSTKTCGGSCCANKCVDVSGTDPKNCGACGKTCSGAESCIGGTCQCGTQGKCTTGQTCCASVGCKNFLNDTQNCGACNRPCKNNETCDNGICKTVPACQGCNGQCCNNTCVDTSNDTSNCGMCNHPCNSGEICDTGSCINPSDLDGGTSMCMCTSQCLLSCFGNCCLEEVLAGTCNPDPNCLGLAG